jgi:hypothetical protein
MTNEEWYMRGASDWCARAQAAEGTAARHLHQPDPDWYNRSEAHNAIRDAKRYWIFAVEDLLKALK